MTSKYAGYLEAKITPEKVEALRKRIGKERPVSDSLPFNSVAHPDTMRHFAFGVSEDNPLYTDEAYAAETRWGGLIASPFYQSTLGRPDLVLNPGQTLRRLRDPLRSIHVFVSGQETEFFRPVRPGDELYRRNWLHGVETKRSQFTGTISVHATRRSVARNQKGEPVSMSNSLAIHTERETAASKGKYSEHVRPHYTPEDVERIDAAYGNEYVRGAEPRYWEDVNVGDELPEMVRGPLLVLDVIGMHVATSQGLWPMKLAYKHRRRSPGYFIPNEFGFPDVTQRCHWDDAWAQAIGNPYAYDYAVMRENWLATYLTNWMGDDAWLWKFRCEMRRFNYIGDTQWFYGRVVKKYQTDEGTSAVDVEMWGQNQTGEVTCPGTASILLPSREKGLPALPTPPEDIRIAAAKGREYVDAASYLNDE